MITIYILIYIYISHIIFTYIYIYIYIHRLPYQQEVHYGNTVPEQHVLVKNGAFI